MGQILSMWRTGIGAPVGLVMILAMIMVPLAPIVLDIFFTFNIALSMIVLLVAVYVLKPLDFVVFPTVLLLTTLMRLALNVASTRVVLLEGHTGPDAAGQVIKAFGEFVIGGNYAVGFVVFSILVVINFVVVTKGAGRIAEVSARFTLDAMPGKQMAIDADLNAGVLDQDGARDRREEIIREADFYGSMDGASKFVRGDAIAGILILVINILGGLAVGMVQHHLEFGQAVQNYVLLAIGDGLVAQIPSLLLSTAAAIVVSRVSTSEDMGQQISKQMISNPKVLFVTAGVMGFMGLVPGMPNFAFLTFAVVIGVMGWRKLNKPEEVVEEQSTEIVEARPSEEVSWDDVAPVDVLGLEVGYRLIPLVDRNQGGQLMSRIKGVRKKFSAELGFLIPPVHIRDNLELKPNVYRITLLGVVVAEGEVQPDRELAINPGTVVGEVPGLAGVDPAFGLEAVWIVPADRDNAQSLGYTVVDVGTVISTHLSRVIQENADRLIGRDEVARLVETLKERSANVTDVLPESVSQGLVLKVMRNLLAEGVPIRDMRTLAEILAELGTGSQDPDAVTDAARVALGHSIVQKLCGTGTDVPVIVLDPDLERILLDAYRTADGHAGALDPGLAEHITSELLEAAQRQEMAGHPAVLIVPQEIRSGLSRFLRPGVPILHVLAYPEVPSDKRLKVVALVGKRAA